MEGYLGRILRVNLTTMKISDEPLKIDYARKFIGGRGLAAKILFDEVERDVDPLSPANRIIFATGPLSGVATSARCTLTTKSPLTGIYLYSVAGGDFGPAIKRSGFDAIIVGGRTEKPVYLSVDDGKAVLRDAEWLWGVPTFEASRLIKETVGADSRIALIGPAGERLVKFSSVITDNRRAFGRGGAGAVMGSKNLKAVAFRGTKRPLVANRELFSSTLQEIHRSIRENPGPRKDFPLSGTQDGSLTCSGWGIYPTRNWTSGTFEGAEKISYPRLRDNFVIRDTGCVGCPTRCAKITLVREGPYAGSLTEGPEYETLYALGGCCGVDSPEALITADMLCDNLGLDTMSTGVTIAFAMECFGKGLITKEDTGGLEFNFGNHDTVVKAVKMCAYRQGFGDTLAEGTRRLAEKIGRGSERFAMHVKGLELGGYDPRGAFGQGLQFAVGSRGGCHHSLGLPARVETVKRIQFEVEGKGKMLKSLAISRVLFDCAELCTFINNAISLENIASLLTAVRGEVVTAKDLETIGERIITLERAFNACMGLSRIDDVLPRRLLEDPLPDGAARGRTVKAEDLELMKEEFYRGMDWDVETGLPTRNCLERLELQDVAEKMEAAGRLPR